MISFKNVSKYYPTKEGRRQILKDISYDFEHGQDIGILGKNGAGKSTLFRLISGSENPEAGQIIRRARVSWPLGFSGGFHGSLTGRENTRFVSRIYGKDMRQIFDYVADFAELGNYIDMPIKSYSSGMKARLAFGLSMAIDFDFYLIDEVIAVGDTAFKKKCKKALAEKRKNSTVILISHSNSLLKQFCTRGAVLNDGVLEIFSNIEDAIDKHEQSQSGIGLALN